jgi:hypothetical protein
MAGIGRFQSYSTPTCKIMTQVIGGNDYAIRRSQAMQQGLSAGSKSADKASGLHIPKNCVQVG